ncbi:MAG: hypothetical protein QOJ04_2480 [Caballeronia sp.]|nr:hypothetical protein [Caballeronia sp.]
MPLAAMYDPARLRLCRPRARRQPAQRYVHNDPTARTLGRHAVSMTVVAVF